VVLDYPNKVPQKIHFVEIPEQIIGNPDYGLNAYASSGLPVTYSSSDPGIATIVDGKVHIVAPGTCTITASQTGDASYETAQDVSHALIVKAIAKVPQQIYFDEIPEQKMGNPDYDLQAYASSGLPVTYSSNIPGIATIIEGKVHMVAPGTCTITASQPGDASYEAAQDVSHILVVHEVTAEKEIMNSSLQIYPNPCNDFVYIKSVEPGPLKVQLMDIFGKSYFIGYSKNNTLDMKGLPQGVYILNINGSVCRIIKQ
jgi:hypothetical protein